MKIETLYIYLFINTQWVPVALLKIDGDNMTFRYGQKYLEAKDKISIDPYFLPLQDKEFFLPEGFSLFNGIRDAAPDKWGNYLLGKQYGRELSELESALYNSADRVGAMAFGPDLNGPTLYDERGTRPYTYGPYINLENCQLAIDGLENNEDIKQLRDYLQYGPSLGGARPKATVNWKNKLYLAKFSLSGDFKNEPLTEFASMSLAKKCGIEVPAIEKTTVIKRDVFLIERFDRDEAKNPLHFISALTATGIHESEYGRFDYGELITAIKSFSFQPEKDIEALFRQLAFNVYINNSDDHLRNFGFLNVEGKGYRLSPAYDLTSILVRNQKSSLSLKFGKHEKEASVRNLQTAYEYFGLEKQKCSEIIEQIAETTSHWKKLYRGWGVSEDDISKLEKSFEVI